MDSCVNNYGCVALHGHCRWCDKLTSCHYGNGIQIFARFRETIQIASQCDMWRPVWLNRFYEVGVSHYSIIEVSQQITYRILDLQIRRARTAVATSSQTKQTMNPISKHRVLLFVWTHSKQLFDRDVELNWTCRVLITASSKTSWILSDFTCPRLKNLQGSSFRHLVRTTCSVSIEMSGHTVEVHWTVKAVWNDNRSCHPLRQ